MLDADLTILAARHRTLVRSWALLIGAYTVLLAPSVLGSGVLGGTHWPYVWMLAAVLTVLSPLVLAVLAFRLFTSTGMPPVPAAVMCIVVLIPVLGPLIIVPMMARDAMPLLQERFGRIPMLGLSAREVSRVLDIVQCTQCGYDLRGLERRRCPECGQESPDLPESP